MRPAALGPGADARKPKLSATVRAFDSSPKGQALVSAETAAQAKAQASHSPVAVASMTTPTSMLVAEPDGRFRQTTYVQPVRFQRNGAWVTISTRLRRAGGGWAPGTVPTSIRLSDGGTGPVATLTSSSGQRTQLTFPGRLSRPVIFGDTATYHTSVPGQTLALTVTPQGGITERITRPTGQITHMLHGALATTAIGGAPTPAGTWSAVTPAARTAFRLSASPVIALRESGQRSAQSQEVLAVTPDSVPGCSSTGGAKCSNGGGFTTVKESDPTPNTNPNPYWDNATPATYGMPIGNQDYTNCSPGCLSRDRSYFQIPLSQLSGNMVVTGAHLYVDEVYGSDFNCSDTWSASVTWTGAIGQQTTWANPPADNAWSAYWTGVQPAFNPGDNANSPCPGGGATDFPFSFNVLTMMQDAVARGWTSWAFRIAGDEGPSTMGNPNGVPGACTPGSGNTLNGLSTAHYNCGYMEINANPEIITDYDLVPPITQKLTASPVPIDNPAPGNDDEGCGSTVGYLNQNSVWLTANPQSGISGEPVKAEFTLQDIDGNYVTNVKGFVMNNKSEPDTAVTDNTPVNTEGVGLKNGDLYGWWALSETDGASTWGSDGSYGPLTSATGSVCRFIVDTTTPPVPQLTGVSETSDGTSTGTSVTLTVANSEPEPTGCGFSPCLYSGIYQYDYSLNNNQFPTNPCSGTTSGCVTATGHSALNPYVTTYTGPIISTTQVSAPAAGDTTVNLCLDDKGGGTGTGTPVDVAQCNGTAAQNWTYSAATSYLKVDGVCAEATGDATTVGTPIELAPCSSNTLGESWVDGADGSWVNVNSSLCVNIPQGDVPGTTQLTLSTCGGGSSQNWSQATATITVPISQWGTNTIYLKSETGAGVTSSSYSAYSFYVPSNAQSVPGDTTADGVPDLLATTTNGDLYVYQGVSGSTQLGTPQLASNPADDASPDGQSNDWKAFMITHRGVASSGLEDDLVAYDPDLGLGGTMDRYTDADALDGAFPGTLPYDNHSDSLSVSDPENEFWTTAGLSQILAIGNPLQVSSTDSNAPAVPPGLLTIENKTLWYYPGNGGGSLSSQRVRLGDNTWDNMTLIAPGYVGPNHQEELWARDDITGNLYAYKFYNCSGAVSLSASCSTTGIPPEGGSDDIQITLPNGVSPLTKLSYPTITSAGDAFGGTPAALYVVDNTGNIDAITINPNPATNSGLLQGGLTHVGSAPSGTSIVQLS